LSLQSPLEALHLHYFLANSSPAPGVSLSTVHLNPKEPTMKPIARKFPVILFLILFLCAASALAGPPLICHSFDIGNAKSLPWIGESWNLTGKETYDVSHLVSDTTAILDADPTVLVHMETLRRATLYGQKDPELAKHLLLTLISRANAANNTSAAALANFDAGYLAEAMKQYEGISKSESPAHNFDGYARIKKALELNPNNPQMNFAAALVTMNGPADEHNAYAQKTLAGTKFDPLLTRNLSTHFISPQSETMAQMITRNSTVKVAQQ
jgi:hypothetical protein